MKLTKGFSLSRFLEEINYPDSVCGIAVNQKNEIVMAIAYDITNKKPKESVFTSMIYNDWIEDGIKISAYKYGSPKAIWEAFKFYALITKEEKEKFLAQVELPEVNLNMLFIDLLPSYGHILNTLKENQPISKQEFVKLFERTYSTTEPRNNLFLHSIHQSQFESIRKKQGAAYFNQ